MINTNDAQEDHLTLVTISTRAVQERAIRVFPPIASSSSSRRDTILCRASLRAGISIVVLHRITVTLFPNKFVETSPPFVATRNPARRRFIWWLEKELIHGPRKKLNSSDGGILIPSCNFQKDNISGEERL